MHIPHPPFSQKLLVIAIYSTLVIGAISVANAVSTIVMDGTTGVTPALTTIAPTGTTYTIDGATHGTQNGSNLFFSFSQFGIGAGDTALFQCPNCVGVTNVISRVTGANPSVLNGAITSSIGISGLTIIPPSGISSPTFTFANFWFFNPNGVTLGVNPAVNFNLPPNTGATITGTPSINFGDKANRVIFNTGAIFGLTTSPTDSTLVAPIIGPGTAPAPSPNPTSFGFPPPAPTPTPTPTPIPAPPTPQPSPPDVVSKPPQIKISPQGDISMVVASQPPTVNAVISPPLPKKPCDKADGVLNKGVANYIPDISSQVPNSVTGAGVTSGESLEQTQSSSLDESDGCL